MSSSVKVIFFSCQSQKNFFMLLEGLEVLYLMFVLIFQLFYFEWFWYRFSDWTANERIEIWNLSWVYLQRTSDHMQQFWLEEWAWFQLPMKNSLLVARLNKNYSLIHITSGLFRFFFGRFSISLLSGWGLKFGEQNQDRGYFFSLWIEL